MGPDHLYGAFAVRGPFGYLDGQVFPGDEVFDEDSNRRLVFSYDALIISAAIPAKTGMAAGFFHFYGPYFA